MIDTLEAALKHKRSLKIIGHYGVSFLDDFLLGIHEKDFVLIGSYTGQGKSEMIYETAFRNSKDLRVHLFALEADSYEPHIRKIYKVAAQRYFDLYRKQEISEYVPNISYRNYITNGLPSAWDEYENYAVKKIAQEAPGLAVHYRESSFTIKTLLKKIKDIENKCDLLIIDHIDYFDMEKGENENAHMTELMKQLRNINLVYEIPIIIVSHMRKKSNKKQIVPDEEDFMGSSNKAKQVKTVIIFARDTERDHYEKGLYGTFCRVAKARVGGTGALVARLQFDSNTNTYDREYKLSQIQSYGEKVANIDYEKAPLWAENIIKV